MTKLSGDEIAIGMLNILLDTLNADQIATCLWNCDNYREIKETLNKDNCDEVGTVLDKLIQTLTEV